MNLNEFAKEIHANACDKGFWDEPRPFDELCALMISELSEALEEARAGRPMEWYKRMPNCHPNCADERIDECEEAGTCILDLGALKPEGIAVEMADCAIRILDYLGSKGDPIDEGKFVGDAEIYKDLSHAFMKVCMHIVDAREHNDVGMDEVYEVWSLEYALCIILDWFEANGLDFEAIARRKHEYNKTRERLHGKLF